MKNMRGEEVVRILRELVLGEGSAHLVDGRRADGEQQDATDDFEDAVEALEDDCDRERSIEPVTALEPVHRVRTWRGSGTASPSDGSCHRVTQRKRFPLMEHGQGGAPDSMRVKMILPALTEATSPLFRPIKYSLFPPLGLATLAAYVDDGDEVTICDEHVEKLRLDDEPDLVVIQVYITSARRSYEIADHYRRRGARVVLGGLHVTSLPDEAAAHADHIFMGPGEDTWPQFLDDLRRGAPLPRYVSRERTLAAIPPIRRDLIKRHLYLVPNSIVVSRGCPHVCDFCYKVAFFQGGKQFYTMEVDRALSEIDRLPGRHLYFLDDHLFGNPNFATALFDGMAGMGRLWQAAGTVNTVLTSGLLERAVDAGLRSLFVGFETLNPVNLLEQHKYQHLRRDYADTIHRLHDLGVMINGSFV